MKCRTRTRNSITVSDRKSFERRNLFMAYRKRNASETEGSNGSLPAGLYVVGKIASRTRRYFIDDFAPLSYNEVSSPVTLSVYVKPFMKRNGDTSYTLCIQKITIRSQKERHSKFNLRCLDARLSGVLRDAKFCLILRTCF